MSRREVCFILLGICFFPVLSITGIKNACYFPEIVIPKVSNPPVIDGKVLKEEWKNASTIVGFISMNERKQSEPKSIAYICYDDKNIYVGWEIKRDNKYKIKREVVKRDGKVWKDDSVEFWLQVEGELFAFLGNANDVVADYRKGKGGFFWNADWDYKSSITENGWEAEMKIPFKEIGKFPQIGDKWKGNFAYYRYDPEIERPSWSFLGGKFSQSAPYHGTIVFGDKLAIRIMDIGNLALYKSGINGEIVNNTAKEKKIRIKTFLYYKVSSKEGEIFWKYRNTYYKLKDSKEISLRITPKSKKSFLIIFPTQPNEYLISYSILDEKTNDVLSKQDVPFTSYPPLRITLIPCYLHKKVLEVEIDFRNFTDMIGKGEAEIRILQNKEIVHYERLKMKKDVVIKEIDVSKLSPGNYTLSVRLLENNQEIVSHKVSFKKPELPEWYNSDAGRTDEVLPPWTPIKISGNTVEVWGRKYIFSPSGNVRQIYNKAEIYYPKIIPPSGIKMFNLPMSYYLKVNGGEEKLIPQGLKLISRSPAKVKYYFNNSGRYMRLKGVLTIEYDGMVRYDIQLIPLLPCNVEEFSLRFPLNKNYIKLYNIYGLKEVKGTYCPTPGMNAGLLPENSLRMDFTPMLWIGDWERGLTWFAESTEHWFFIKNKAIEIIPTGKNVILKVNFINLPKRISSPLKFTYGIQASPVKPFLDEKTFQVKYRMIQTPRGKPLPESISNSFLFYPADGNINLSEGNIEFWAKAEFKPEKDFSIFHLKRNAGVDLMLRWEKGVFTFGTRREKITSKILKLRNDKFYHIKILWHNRNCALFLNDKKIGDGKLPEEYFSGKLEKEDKIIFGGEETLTLDEIKISSKGKTLLYDPLEKERFYRGKKLTRPTKISSKGIKGGIAGSKYISGQVKLVPAYVGKGLYLPCPSFYDDIELAKDYKVKRIYCYGCNLLSTKPNYYHTPFTPSEEVKKLVDKYHKRGMKVFFYYGASFSQRNPYFKYFGWECVRYPLYPSSYDSFVTCNRSQSANMKIDGIRKAIKYYDIDGVFLDHVAHIMPCRNQRHGCGYINEKGEVIPTYPVFAAREVMKRIYALFHGKKKIKDGQVIAHTGDQVPIFGFSDFWASGEAQMHTKKKTLKNLFPLYSYASFYGSQQYGVPRMHLTKGKAFPFGPNWLYALSLLHNQLLRTMSYQFNPRLWYIGGKYNPYYVKVGKPYVADPTLLIWQIRDEFGIGEKEVRFYPYWKNKEYLKLNPSHLVGSFHLNPEKGIHLIVSNFEKNSVKCTAEINFKKLGLSMKDLIAYDPLLDEEIQMKDGKLYFTIGGEIYKLINVVKRNYYWK